MGSSNNAHVATKSQVLTDDFAYEVLSVVAEVPEGCVATYGQIARLVGRPKNARLVARVLAMSQDCGSYPCHRIVNASGRLAPHWPEQALLLLDEGVDVRDGAHVSLKHFQWEC